MQVTIPEHWSQGSVDVDGGSLHYYRTGQVGKPSLILQHGFSDDGLCWIETASDLEAEYDILLPDARGHGLSARVEPGQKLDRARDLVEMIRNLELEKPIIAGHSMGAMIAGQVGWRFPDVPRALILEDPPWRSEITGMPAPGDPPREHPMAGVLQNIAEHSAEELMQQARLEHPTWPEAVIQTWCSAKKRLDPNILTTSSLHQESWQDSIQQITCPVLLFTGDPDHGAIVMPQIVEEIKVRNPRFTLAHIPGVGHHIRFGNFTLYMVHFRRFLDSL